MSDFFEKLKNGKEKLQKFGDEQKKARQTAPFTSVRADVPTGSTGRYIVLTHPTISRDTKWIFGKIAKS